MYTELLNLANGEIERVKQYLKDNENALFTMHDLKLHDVSYYLFDDFGTDFPLTSANYNSDDIFNFYCQCTFDIFNECVKSDCEQDFETLAHYIGRTSKFYLNDFSDRDNAIFDLFNDFSDRYLWGKIDIDDDEKIIVVGESDATADFITFINDFYSYVGGRCYPFIKCYETIEAFKENQVDSFKEFISCNYETTLREKADAERAKEKADNETIRALIEKYKIPENDAITMKNTIYAL